MKQKNKLDIKSALKRPFTNYKKLLLSLIFFHSNPFIMAFFGEPYGLLCGKSSFENKSKLPEWKNFRNLTGIGIRLVGFSFIYLFSLVIILWPLLYFFNFSISNFVEIISIPHFGFLYYFNETFQYNLIALSIILLLGFMFNLFLSAIMMVFIINGKFSQAFNFKDIIKIAFNKKFILLWAIFLPLDYFVLFLNKILPLILLAKFFPNLHWMIFFSIYGFFPAFFNYFYAVVYRTLSGKIIRKMKYKPTKKSLWKPLKYWKKGLIISFLVFTLTFGFGEPIIKSLGIISLNYFFIVLTLSLLIGWVIGIIIDFIKKKRLILKNEKRN